MTAAIRWDDPAVQALFRRSRRRAAYLWGAAALLWVLRRTLERGERRS